MVQDGSRVVQDAPGWSRMVQYGSRMVQGGPTWFQDGSSMGPGCSRMIQGGSRMFQDGSSMGPGWSRVVHDGCRMFQVQDGPGFQDCSRMLQDGSMMVPGCSRFRMVQDVPGWFQDAPGWRLGLLLTAVRCWCAASIIFSKIKVESLNCFFLGSRSQSLETTLVRGANELGSSIFLSECFQTISPSDFFSGIFQAMELNVVSILLFLIFLSLGGKVHLYRSHCPDNTSLLSRPITLLQGE